jgi:hypothetical protein
MTSNLNPSRISRVWFSFTALLAVAAIICSTDTSWADEDGVSFLVPGFFGSLAAAPQQPGWSLTSIAALSREITIGQFRPAIDINVNAHVHAVADLGFVIPSYVFATPFLGRPGVVQSADGLWQ